MKLFTRSLLVILWAATVGREAGARPVTFKGGWGLMSENRFDQNEAMVSYTFLRSFAADAHVAAFRLDSGAGPRFFVPELSALLKRWNNDDSQANLYAQGGYGFERGAKGVNRGAFLAALEGDFETRQFYASARSEVYDAFRDARLSYGRARIGLAPYVAGFESLHTWILLQTEARNWRSGVTVGPVLRFFFRNFQWEIGSDWSGRWTFNFAAEI